MALQFVVITGYGSGRPEDENEPHNTIERLKASIGTYPYGAVEYRVKETDHGVGADFPTVTVDVLVLGAATIKAVSVFLDVPAARKRVRDALSGWKDIKSDVDRFFGWFKKAEGDRIYAYSKEVAFLEALGRLEPKTQILELETLAAVEIAGSTNGEPEAGFESSNRMYYLFAFRGWDYAYVLLYNARLELLMEKTLPLSDIVACDDEDDEGTGS